MIANDFDDDDGDGDFARKTKHPSTLAMPGSASAVGVKPTGVFVNAILCHFCNMEHNHPHSHCDLLPVQHVSNLVGTACSASAVVVRATDGYRLSRLHMC